MGLYPDTSYRKDKKLRFFNDRTDLHKQQLKTCFIITDIHKDMEY